MGLHSSGPMVAAADAGIGRPPGAGYVKRRRGTRGRWRGRHRPDPSSSDGSRPADRRCARTRPHARSADPAGRLQPVGMSAVMRVPFPGALRTSSLPPSCSARARIPARPRCRGRPRSSRSRRRRPRPSGGPRRAARSSEIRTAVADACLTTLWIASCAMRKRPVSTASGGRSGRSCSTVTGMPVRPSTAAACVRTAWTDAVGLDVRRPQLEDQRAHLGQGVPLELAQLGELARAPGRGRGPAAARRCAWSASC